MELYYFTAFAKHTSRIGDRTACTAALGPGAGTFTLTLGPPKSLIEARTHLIPKAGSPRSSSTCARRAAAPVPRAYIQYKTGVNAAHPCVLQVYTP